MQADDIDGDNIDPQLMAWSAIAVLITSRIISAAAIFNAERNIRRAIFQLFDLLIFEEIYESHKKILSQIKNKQSLKDKNAAIESTLSFKFVRQFEAVYESIPQSVLQLVYVMRTTEINWIFGLSIAQSVISMTNSIVNNDNTQMQEDKWKAYKQRLPPTLGFIKHALSRFSEVAYRIGLLALLWTVCGGLPFGIVLAVDASLIIAKTVACIFGEMYQFDADTILLNASQVIVLPSEEVYNNLGEDGGVDWRFFFGQEIDSSSFGDCMESTGIICIYNICCCCGLAALFSALSSLLMSCKPAVSVYPIPTQRIGVSLMEFVFLIFYGLFGQNGKRKHFLLDEKHGLTVFIVTCLCFLIYTQYLKLFPNFSLPGNVAVRSRWGYAFANELSELQKLRISSKPFMWERMIHQQCDDESGPDEEAKRFMERVQTQIVSDNAFVKQAKAANRAYTEVDQHTVGNTTFVVYIRAPEEERPGARAPEPSKQEKRAYFWDAPHSRKADGLSAAIFALAKEHYAIVDWLEAQGATLHIDRNVTVEKAKRLVGGLKDKKD